MLLCSVFPAPAFQEETVFVPPSQLLPMSHGCHRLEASPTGRRRPKGGDLRIAMGTKPLPGPPLCLSSPQKGHLFSKHL